MTDRELQLHRAPPYEAIAFSGQRQAKRKHFVANPQAEIRVAPSDDGSWMWATSYYSFRWGFGSVPLPKWGRFAPSREAAISAGVDEMLATLATHEVDKAQASVIAWLEAMREPKQAELFT